MMRSQCSRTSHNGDTSVVERQVSDRKVAESRFDSRTGHASLCLWERQLTLISHRGLRSLAVVELWRSLAVVAAQPDGKLANNSKKCSPLVLFGRRSVPGSCQ